MGAFFLEVDPNNYRMRGDTIIQYGVIDKYLGEELKVGDHIYCGWGNSGDTYIQENGYAEPCVITEISPPNAGKDDCCLIYVEVLRDREDES